jgi:hypothetical protein
MTSRFPFEGKEVTVAELSARFTCYSRTWLAEALKAGCCSPIDLSRHYQQGRARQKHCLRPLVRGLRPMKVARLKF